MPFQLADVSTADFVLIAVVAFASSILGGLSGYGVGLILPAFLAPLVGVGGVIPVMSVAMAITNLSRAVVFARDIAWRQWRAVMLPGLPCAVLGAYVYTLMPLRAVAVLVGGFLMISVPLRRALERRSFVLGSRGLVVSGAVWGILAGGMTGTGLLLISALMAAGVRGAGLVGTDASVSVIVNLVKAAVFGRAALIDAEMLLAGLLIGACTVPGALVARWLMRRIPVHVHTVAMDVLVILGGAAFLLQGFL